MDLFTLFALVLFFILSVYLIITKECFPLHHTYSHTNPQVQLIELERGIYILNVASNIVLIIPAIFLFIMGFYLEGCIVSVCSVLSSYYHLIGGTTLSILDRFFALLTALVLAVTVIRSWQLRGPPTFVSIFLFAAVLGLNCYTFMNMKKRYSATKAKCTHIIIQPDTQAGHIFDRILHALWHILVAFSLAVAVLELQLSPSIIPNSRMRQTLRTISTISNKFSRSDHVYATLFSGVFASIFTKK